MPLHAPPGHPSATPPGQPVSPARKRMLERMNCSLTEEGPTYLTSTRSIFGPAVCDHAAVAQPSMTQVPNTREIDFIS